MINTSKLDLVLLDYKKAFCTPDPKAGNITGWEKEKYKWAAIKHFQKHWNIDAENFAAMFKEATAKHINLFDSMNYFPRGMILEFAKVDQEAVRAMFRNLFNEALSVVDRVNDFIAEAERLRSTYGADSWKSHFQNVNSISTYLWSMYPDKYYIYKYSECKQAAAVLESDFQVKKGAKADVLIGFLKFYDEVADYLIRERSTAQMLKSAMTDDCYQDPKCRTLAIDVCFYISRYYVNSSNVNEGDDDDFDEDDPNLFLEDWFPALSEYTPQITKQQWLDLLKREDIIGPIWGGVLAAFYEVGGAATCIQIAQKYGKNASGISGNCTQLAKRIYKETQCPLSVRENGKKRFWPILFQGKSASSNTQGGFVWKLRQELYEALKEFDIMRFQWPIPEIEKSDIKEANYEKYTKEDFLSEVYMDEEQYDSLVSLLKNKKNLIMQGAPGVGKTYAAKRLAYSMMGKKDESCIEFIQFHQNYSYEDFMMGYRPTETGFELKYGVFHKFCSLASNHPDKNYFFIIDEINRGNMSKIFGELLLLIEKDYRAIETTLAYNGMQFSVPENIFLIGMMNTADRSLAMIDYALRRRFSFFTMSPGFDSKGFKDYQVSLHCEKLNRLIDEVKNLNKAIANDKSLGNGFCIGHSYFCGHTADENDSWVKEVVKYDLIPMLSEYWFDDDEKVKKWSELLSGVVNG